VPSSTSMPPSKKGHHKVLQRAQHPSFSTRPELQITLNGVLHHERKITLHHRNSASAKNSRTTHFHHNNYINFSPNHPILESTRSESPTHPSKSVRNKRRTICRMTMAFHLGTSIAPSHVHILLVGHLLKRQSSMEVIRSRPVLQAGMHGQARRNTWSMYHAKILSIILSSVPRSDIPRVHLFIDASFTMELARHELPQYGY
jgi:hypothetical protein